MKKPKGSKRAKAAKYWVICQDSCGVVVASPSGVTLARARQLKREHAECGDVTIERAPV